MPFEGGPYVQAACFCDLVIEDKSGSISLIRIIDNLTRTAPSGNIPDTLDPFIYNLKLVIMLKADKVVGRHTVHIEPELPNGSTLPKVSLNIQMKGEEFGANIIMNMPFQFTLEGLYWFFVYFDDALITKIPFRVIYNPIRSG